MLRTTLIACCISWVVLASGSVSRAEAQALPRGNTATPVEGDPGISSNWRMMEDSSFSVARDYAEPGATRRMHNHPEFTYHVLVLLTGTLRLTIKGETPRVVNAGEVVRIPAGADHTFTNIDTVVATLVEVFGKKAAPTK